MISIEDLAAADAALRKQNVAAVNAAVRRLLLGASQ